MPTHADISRSREHQVLAVRANVERAALKLEIEYGEISLARALVSTIARRVPAYDLLRAQCGWGHTKARRALLRVGIDRGVRCGQMTERQRERLLEVLGGGR